MGEQPKYHGSFRKELSSSLTGFDTNYNTMLHANPRRYGCFLGAPTTQRALFLYVYTINYDFRYRLLEVLHCDPFLHISSIQSHITNSELLLIIMPPYVPDQECNRKLSLKTPQ